MDDDDDGGEDVDPYNGSTNGGGGGGGGPWLGDMIPISAPPFAAAASGGGGGQSTKLSSMIWIGAGLLLFLFAIAVAALALGIWAVVVASENRRMLNDATESGLVMKNQPTKEGQTPRWDPTSRGWVPGHGRFQDLEDVFIGGGGEKDAKTTTTKKTWRRQVEDGDLLGWERGRLMNLRNPLVDQRFSDHADVRIHMPRTGDVTLYNGTSGHWQNVPLSALLALDSLRDIDRESVQSDKMQRGTALEFDGRKWVARGPHASAMLRFCAPTAHHSLVLPTQHGGGDGDVENDTSSWGRLDPPLNLNPASSTNHPQWTPLHPVSPTVGVFATQGFSRGGMTLSRKRVSLTTPTGPRNVPPSRPTNADSPFMLRAIITCRGFPSGSFGFLIGTESAPPDDQTFYVDPTTPTTTTTTTNQWTFETVREIGPGQEIRLGFLPQLTPALRPWAHLRTPLVQCLTIYAEGIL